MCCCEWVGLIIIFMTISFLVSTIEIVEWTGWDEQNLKNNESSENI